MGAEYKHIDVVAYWVADDDKKARGWRKDGSAVLAREDSGSDSLRHELFAIEGFVNREYLPWVVSEHYTEVQKAFLQLLNRFAGDGWRVALHSSHASFQGATDPWPLGDFLLVRET